MKPYPLYLGLPILFLCLSLCLGCGPKRPDGMPDVFPTTITITIDGVPLEGAEVIAYPKAEGKTKWFGYGPPTDTQGKIKMMSSKLNGLIADDFAITVRKNVVVKGPPVRGYDGDMTDEYYECYVDVPFWLTDTTPLAITVAPVKMNEFTLDVKKFDIKNFNPRHWAMKIKK